VTIAQAIDGDITLVIPTLGRPLLRETLESVVGGSTWPAKVVIVDQGCAANIEALAREVGQRGLDVDYVPSRRIGRSAGLNTGIDRVATRYFAITDDDCPVARDWMACMGERLRRHDDAIVTGRAVAREGEVQLAVVTSGVESIQRRPALKFDCMTGANLGMSTDIARRIGPFAEDPSMRTAEDAEFAYRALRRGVPIVYAPELVVEHLGWRDEAAREDQYRDYARSHGGFYGWYLRRGDLFIAARAAVHLLRSARRWAVGSWRGDLEAARNGKAYVLNLWPGLVAGFRASGRLRSCLND
jgi:GT2 family glycosyltransferase